MDDGVQRRVGILAQVPQAVQLREYPGSDDRAARHRQGGLIGQLPVQLREQRIAGDQPLQEGNPGGFSLRRCRNGVQRMESLPDLRKLPGQDAQAAGLGRQPFEIAHPAQQVAHRLPDLGLLHEGLHRCLPLFDAADVGQGHAHPPPEHPPAHRGSRRVEHGQERLAIRLHRLDEFQVAHREPIEPKVALRREPPKLPDVPHLVVVGEFKVLEDGPCRCHRFRPVFQAKPLQRLRPKVLLQFFLPERGFEHPVIHPGSVAFLPRKPGNRCAGVAFIQHLGRREGPHPTLHEGRWTLARMEIPGRQVQEGHSGFLLARMEGGQVIVRSGLKHLVVKRGPRGHQLGDAPLDNALGEPRILQLVADRHPVACPNEFGQVIVQGMVRKAREFDFGGAAVSPFRQDNFQCRCRPDGILSEGLVKVAHPKQQDGIRILLLDPAVLLHQRGILACHAGGELGDPQGLGVGIEHALFRISPIYLEFLGFCAGQFEHGRVEDVLANAPEAARTQMEFQGFFKHIVQR